MTGHEHLQKAKDILTRIYDETRPNGGPGMPPDALAASAAVAQAHALVAIADAQYFEQEDQS